MVTCAYAPRAYGLPYRYSIATVALKDRIRETRRRDRGHEFVGSVNGIIKRLYQSGTLEEFLFERYCLTLLTRESYVWHILIMNHGNLELEQ